MADEQIDIIATFYPPKGAVDKFAEILSAFAAWVKDNEPTTTRYELVREVKNKSGVESLLMLERYKDKAALKAHGSSKEFKTMFGKLNEAGLKDGKVEMKYLKQEGGFGSRL